MGRLFETYLILGEVSLENENYPQAVDDLTVCLEKQKAALPEDSRNIAVTFYQLGIALGFNMKYEEAIEKLEMAGVLGNIDTDESEEKSDDDEEEEQSEEKDATEESEENEESEEKETNDEEDKSEDKEENPENDAEPEE